MGKTDRNAPMWGPPGRAYVYLCYGMHNMLNLVTDRVGVGTAVLIRAAEPVDGLDIVRARRADKAGPVLLAGPGKIGAALGLDTSWSHHPLYRRGGLEALDGAAVDRLAVGPRIGIDYASPADRAALLRFADADSAWVTHRKLLLANPKGAGTTGAT